MTTGPHLHFEVFEDKQYVDPLKYLDTSFLPYSSLPEKYKYKFLEDFKIRKGYEFEKPDDGKVFFLEGATEVERQKSLLNKYATPEFRNWNMWVEESLDGGVDPSFVMCLGLAESGLGRFLKTPYNIGNVGNTDSGATWDLPNARSGVYRIVRTLNNDILSQYTEIRQLSRFGNKDGSIYASSPFNWHNNITKCMSHLKGEYVPDDYNFRLR
ncbi:MAG: hypothetical protein H6767_03390 [Candidatus Peribacteria bacterium]|nr:MAG: hypothetical protein H6767_03390 [Candidatus Peribacteria bacterium]